MSLYRWLLLLHLAGLSTFLLAHGVTAGAALGLRGRPSLGESRLLLRLSLRGAAVSYAGLLLLIVTGVWMGFLGSWWGRAWIWAAIGVFVGVFVAMGLISNAYRGARSATDERLGEAVARTRPLTATWVGTFGLAALLLLMVLKPF